MKSWRGKKRVSIVYNVVNGSPPNPSTVNTMNLGDPQDIGGIGMVQPVVVFDNLDHVEITQKREAWLRNILGRMLEDGNLTTAVDVGCGVGYFSDLLRALGLNVTGIDGRPGNIEEAQRRYPEIDFQVLDVEEPATAALGPFDLVLCLGLLYHLENPFRAIRNLSSMTGGHIIIDTLVVPDNMPVALLQDEVDAADQGLDNIAFIPSETCLARMLYKSGFQSVYAVKRPPSHPEYFKKFLWKSRMRTILVASKTSLGLAELVSLPDTAMRWDWARPTWYLNLGKLKRLMWRLAKGSS